MSKTSIPSAPSEQNLTKWVILFISVAVIIFGLSFWGWWHSIRSNPTSTFYGAVENNLKLRGATRTIMQDGQGQSVEQRVQATFGPQHIAHGVTDIKQKTDVIDTTIQTETISTPKKDYVRYTQLNTSQKNPEGKELDFSKVLNVWGRVDEGGGELYSQSTLGVVPSGNLTAADREALVRFMRDKNLYEFDESKVDRKIENGRPVYVYDVTAKPDLYVTMLKQYAKAVGVTQLESVDPSAYAGRDALQFRVTIDVWSRQFVAVSFGGGQQTEKLSGYGVSKPVALPKESITVDELQSRLQTVQ